MAEFPCDDSASLREALAMLDNWDNDLTALFESGCEGAASQGRHSRQSKSAHAAAPYTQRHGGRKLEIAALRAQVEELEDIVAVEEALVVTSAPAIESPEEIALRNEWKRIANSQHRQRSAVEVENATLRELVKTQASISQQILELTACVKPLAELLPSAPMVSFENYSGPQVDFRAQLRQLDAMVPRASELFTSGAFTREGHDCFQEVHFREDDPHVRGAGVQYEASWLFPFGIERVADALWVQTVRPTFKQKTVAYRVIHEDANSLVSQFISTSNTNGVWGASQGQVAARRLPRDLSDGSFLIIVTGQFRAYMDSKWQGSADLQGWLRIESVASRDAANAQPLTRVKWYRQTLVQPPEVEAMAQSELREWMHRVISGPTQSRFERDLKWSRQAVENSLLTPTTWKVQCEMDTYL